MNDTRIVTVYVILDDLLRAMGHRTDRRARTSDSEVLTVGVIAACRLQNHHERALCILRGMGYLSGPLSISRFNQRLHALAHRLSDAVDLLAALLTAGTVFIIDSMPLAAVSGTGGDSEQPVGSVGGPAAARTLEGWTIKVLASLFALLCVNAD